MRPFLNTMNFRRHILRKIVAPDEVPKANDSRSRPDIYFIIPDGYPSDAWLQQEMNYDNSEFTEAIKDRGFVIVEHAQTNYATTLFALASTFNVRFYDMNPSPSVT